MPKMTRTEMKHAAQQEIMSAVANLLGYAEQTMSARGAWVGDENADDFQEILRREADRVARLMGYEESWTN